MDTAHLLMNDDTDPWSLLPADKQQKAIALRDYMLGKGRFNSDANDTLSEMARRFLDAGVKLERCATIVRLLHSTTAASMRVWEKGSGAVYVGIPYQPGASSQYDNSPSALAHRSRSWVRFNPQAVSAETFGIIPELKEAGITDYICAPTFMVNGMENVFTFATSAANGFTFEDIAVFRAAFPAIEACQEILVLHRVLKEVTRIYVGAEPHERILAGDVHRGEVTRLKSAILFADMRDFTVLTADMDAEAATALLNDYYDCLVPAIEERGGEVLKFIGDGILAILRAEENEQQACSAALDAAKAGLEAAHIRNEDAATPFEIGIALHLGEVAYGNVGSGERLDYTVIGRDVNLASRIAGLCGSLDQTLLLSGRFMETLSDDGFEDLGSHRLKGLKEPQAVFAPQ